MEYKKPKLKLKKVDVKIAPMGESNSDPKVVEPKSDKPKIIIRKASKPSEVNIIDSRAMTKEAAKEELEKKRVKRELKIKKMLEGM